MNENILTAQQVKMVEEAEPHEILFALHKRVVDTEKLMAAYRNHAKNLELEIGMLKEKVNTLKEKVTKLEEVTKEEELTWNESYPVREGLPS